MNMIKMTLLGGLTVGDPVLRSGTPLSVELGPGMQATHPSSHTRERKSNMVIIEQG